MMVGSALNITCSGTPDDVEAITKGVAEYDKRSGLLSGCEPFVFCLRKEDELMGGCHGTMYYNHQLHTDSLWVDEQLRHQGYGTKLMESVEKLAREKGISLLTVFTTSWQALAFYQKLGYYIELQRAGYPNDGVVYLLRKDI
jgi:ribosomal protein S18 acetylase RimI-like enzyme